MPQDNHSRAAKGDTVTAAQVQQALGLIAREGYVLDAQAYADADKGHRLFADMMKKSGIAYETAPGQTFFFRKGARHIALEWDAATGIAHVSSHVGKIGQSATSHEYSLREFLNEWPVPEAKFRLPRFGH